MGKKEETKFKERIFPQLKSLPNTWVKKIQLVGLHGIPDFILCINSTFVAIELKVDAAIEPLQQWNIDEIQKAKGVALIVTPENWKIAYEFLHTLACEGLEKANAIHH